MSNKDLARRAAVEVAFGGTDITGSIKPYFLSMTYTDNDEDAADDLQIQLQDREGLWTTQWLNDIVDAAATTGGSGNAEGGGSYRVTPNIGLNIRAGPGTSYRKLGAFPYGTVVTVDGISNGWASIQYGGGQAYVSAQYLEQTAGGTGGGSSTSLSIQAVIVRENWNGGGKDSVLDCGSFELDSVKASGPPATVTIKATSLPFCSQIRQTEKTKAWEAYTLSGIAKEMAGENGMACLYESASDPFYGRVEQMKESDIGLLSRLCHDAGISLKATNNILVLFDQAAYEAKPSSFTIKRGGGYLKHNLSIGKADAQYTSCRVRYSDPATGRVIEGTAYVEDYKADGKNNQQLEVTAKVASAGEAQALAYKRLRLHNKYSRTAVFTMVGDPGLAAGITVSLEGWGGWDGKYIIQQAKHTVGGSGYTTQITLRRVLEGY